MLISVGLLQAVYWSWPKAVCSDASFSIFAAQNAVDHGHLESVEPNGKMGPDLGKIRLQWLNSWPPLVSVVYAVLLKSGLTPGGATNCFSLVLLLGGTWCWLLCFKEAQAPRAALYCLAALIPWTAFPLSAMVIFYNDHVTWALAPAAYLLLLRLPVSQSLSKLDFWLTLPPTALVCGSLVVAKYSALSLVLGAGVYFLFRDGWHLHARKLAHAIWFGLFLFLPGAIVYLLNRVWTGEATAAVRGSQPLFPVGLAQFWNLAVSPLMELLGLTNMLFHLPASYVLTAALSLPALAIWFGLGFVWVKRRRTEGPSRFLKVIVWMTVSNWGFLLILTLLLGYQCDWTGQPRYSFPIAFAWFCGGIVLIFSERVPKAIRVLLAVAYLFPVVVTFAAGVTKPFRQVTPALLPQSRLAGTPNEREMFRYLEERMANDPQARPQLIIANKMEPMTELVAAVIPWSYLEAHGKLTSSRPMIVWALLDSASAQGLRHRLDENCTVKRMNTPAGFPGDCLVITFP
jgi:hypothetical protein